MKHNRFLAVMMATVISGMSLSACSLNDDEPESEAPFTTCPVSDATLYACGLSQQGTRSDMIVLFTEDDIEWFNETTREIRLRDTVEPLYKKCRVLSSIEFRLGNETLLSDITSVSLVCSQVFFDLVLCYGKIENGEVTDGYFLNDCYPTIPEIMGDERVQANRERRAPQWEAFISYLKSKGKLRK